MAGSTPDPMCVVGESGPDPEKRSHKRPYIGESNKEGQAGMHSFQFCRFFAVCEEPQGHRRYCSRYHESDHSEVVPSDEGGGDTRGIYPYGCKKNLPPRAPQTEEHREPPGAEAPYEGNKKSPSLEYQEFLVEACRYFGRRRTQSKP